MKAASIASLLLTCALAAPSFGQQKTYNWVSGNDEMVRLDPGYYHTSPPYQPSPGARSMHVDIDAHQPVTVAVVSIQDWNEASQRPESLGSMSLLCVQEHVLETKYSCGVPLGIPVLLLVRDERGDRGAYAGRGEVTGGRDYDKQQAGQPNRDRVPASDADRDREHRDQGHDRPNADRPPDAGRDRVGRAIGAGVDAWTGRTRRQFAYPNDVHVQYYDWACTDNCNLPDPPRPKLFDWVPIDNVRVRLDPGNYYAVRTYDSEGNIHVKVESEQPVSISMADLNEWNSVVPNGIVARNVNTIGYDCVQQHALKSAYDCNVPWPHKEIMVIRDERHPRDSQDAHAQAKPNPNPGDVLRPVSAGDPGAVLAKGDPRTGASWRATELGRQFTAANDIFVQYYAWRCVDACDQPDFGWRSRVNESWTLDTGVTLYGGAVIPDHDGEPVSIHVKSPVPMAVAMLRPKTAHRLVNQPDLLESVVENIPCVQRGVQESTFQCTFNVKDGPQSLVVVPEAGVDIPEHKKAEVSLQAFACIDNCPGPIFGWVDAVNEKYLPTKIFKMYGGFVADHDGEQVSVKIKSPVPMAAALLPTRQAGQLYGKPDLFDSEFENSPCQKRNVLDTFFQCTIDLADGSQALVVRPEPGYANKKNKKAEVQIRTMKCVEKCDVSIK